MNNYNPPQRGGRVFSADSHQNQHFGHHHRGSYHQQNGLNGHASHATQPSNVLQRPQDNASSVQRFPSAPSQLRPNHLPENPLLQIEHLDNLAAQEVPKVEISSAELDEKEAFRQHLEQTLQQALEKGDFPIISSISLVGFGSLASGFGLPGSDMDLAVVPVWTGPDNSDGARLGPDVARHLERAVLDNKMGGRLLTRTRVPILKICQNPTETLYNALLDERKKWEELPEEEKYPPAIPVESEPQSKPYAETVGAKPTDGPKLGEDFPELGFKAPSKAKSKTNSNTEPKPSSVAPTTVSGPPKPVSIDSATPNNVHEAPKNASTDPVAPTAVSDPSKTVSTDPATEKEQHHRSERTWMREKALGPLDFPKTGVGIQCDLNFENRLGIHNTHMLRCYSLTDPRVRPVVLFVKSWAKIRKINSAYNGTLSSYGWVLMVLHYLVNVAQPPVCPNLQHAIPTPTDLAGLERFFKQQETVNGYNVRYWRNEQEIIQAAQSGRLSQNIQTIGSLLRGFFQYYASMSHGYRGPRLPQFVWKTEVLSLRTPGGIQTKQAKGWVSATNVRMGEKNVKNRYLFAIEDPFEIDHNVARTVGHQGIVAIRDEFRRAWRILRAIGQGHEPEGGIFDAIVEKVSSPLPQQGKQDESKKATKGKGADNQKTDPHTAQAQQGVIEAVSSAA